MGRVEQTNHRHLCGLCLAVFRPSASLDLEGNVIFAGSSVFLRLTVDNPVVAMQQSDPLNKWTGPAAAGITGRPLGITTTAHPEK